MALRWIFCCNDSSIEHKNMSKRAVLSAIENTKLIKMLIYYGSDLEYIKWM